MKKLTKQQLQEKSNIVHNNEYIISEYIDDKKILIKHKICGNEFKAFFKFQPIICRKCYPITGNSKLQNEFRNFLNEYNVKFEEGNRRLIKPLEVDFYIPEHNIAVEMNGNYWHSEIGGGKDKKYHLNKTIKCYEKNVKLIHIFEDEWFFKKEIVKSKILKFLKITNSIIDANDCELIEVDDLVKKNFLENNHINGNLASKINIALKYKEDIVSVMSFLECKNERDKCYELRRSCNKINIRVIGAFEKLINYFLENYETERIIVYSDCRWNGIIPENTIYSKTGFSLIEIKSPNYFYALKNVYINRIHRLTLYETIKNRGQAKTEWQLAQENGYDRIWDCGTMKFEYINKKE